MQLDKNQFRVTIISSLVTLLTGILFAIRPVILENLCTALGILLCIAGVVLGVIYFLKKQENGLQLIGGIVSLFLGVILIILPKLLKFLIPVFFGLWILTSAFSGIWRNFACRKSYSLWWVGALLGLVCAGMGVYVITRPVAVLTATVRLIGILMAIHAALRMAALFLGRNCYRNTPPDVIEATIEK